MSKRVLLDPLEIGRGLAIVAVIYGHALAPWVLTAGENFSETAFLQWKFGASFTMALFFFLSGLGWREEKSLAHTLRQSLTLILIALMASVAYDLVRLAVGAFGLAAQLGGHTLTFSGFAAGLSQMIFIGDYYSLSPLWFIVALALVRVIAALAARLNRLAAGALALALLVLSMAAIDNDWRSFYQLKALGAGFAFFMLGHYARGHYHALRARAFAPYAVLAVGLIGAALTFRLNQGCRWDAVAQCGVDWLDGHFGVAMIHGQIGNAPLFALTALLGVAGALGASIVLARLGGVVASKLESWGAHSLNLLIVNSVFLHVGNVFVDRLVAPRFEPDNALFFLVLFALTLSANLIAARIAERPLRQLHHAALKIARGLLNAGAGAGAMLAWARAGDGVSQRNE